MRPTCLICWFKMCMLVLHSHPARVHETPNYPKYTCHMPYSTGTRNTHVIPNAHVRCPPQQVHETHMLSPTHMSDALLHRNTRHTCYPQRACQMPSSTGTRYTHVIPNTHVRCPPLQVNETHMLSPIHMSDALMHLQGNETHTAFFDPCTPACAG